MKRFGIAVAGVLTAAALALGGCSSASSLTNKGGDTTCKVFLGQDTEKQKSTIAKMLKDEHGEDASNLEVTATRMSAEAFCKTLGKDSSKINEISHG